MCGTCLVDGGDFILSVTENKSSQELWSGRVKECRNYVEGLVEAVERGRAMSLGPSPRPLIPPDSLPSAASQPVKVLSRVLYCSPHPDDESLGGGLPLRLRLEAGSHVTNVAITLGSDPTQQDRRRAELESACRVLGFGLVIPRDPSAGKSKPAAGFNRVTLNARQDDPEAWAAKVGALARIFDQEQPDAVFVPHGEDFNTAHIGTHALVIDALGEHLIRSGRPPVAIIEAEFWHQLAEPNLMVGIPAETLAIMLAAAMEHGGEMSRLPYHLLAPARMMDNVRRGSEVVGGQGAAAQNYHFAELHRVVFLKQRELLAPKPGALLLGPGDMADMALIRERFLPL